MFQLDRCPKKAGYYSLLRSRPGSGNIRLGFTGSLEPNLIAGPDGKLTGVLTDFLGEINRRLGTDISVEIGHLTAYQAVFARSDAPFIIYQTLFESANDAIFIMKEDLFVDCNLKTLEMFACTKGQIINKPPYAFSPPVQPDGRGSREKALEKINEAYSGSPQFFEWKHQKYNGTLFDVEVSLNAIELGSELYLQAIVRDITERKRLEDQLIQAQKMESIGTLAGGIAHDFNNILNAIIGFTYLARLKTPEGSDAISSLDRITDSTNRATDLVRQILTFSRMGAEELQPVLIAPIAKEALKLLRASIPATIEFRLNINGTGHVLADPVQIHQIVMNLCTNAYQAMEDRGRVMEVGLQEIHVDQGFAFLYADLRPGLHVQLTVSDTGCGIDASIINRIFEPYFTTKETGA